MPESTTTISTEAMAQEPVYSAPVSASERISSIDVARGFALLGIALMNILFSGLPLSAQFNPNVAGGNSLPNLVAFFLQYILFDGKMRGLFSLMFGAGSYYLIQRGLTRGTGVQAVEVYYRRTLWLMLFGAIHAYLIWHGDILYPYALLGLVLFPLHKLKPKTLLITAAVFVVAMTGKDVAQGFHVQELVKTATEADLAVKQGKTLTEEQKNAQKEWEGMRKYIQPTAEDLKKEADTYEGSYFRLLGKRAAIVRDWHSGPFYMSGWDMLTMMLVGIAFAKLKILDASWDAGFYSKMLLISYGIGLPVGGISAWLAYQQNFEAMQTVFTFSTYQSARVAMTIGHLSLLLLICKNGWLPALRSRLAAVGQTAFSNYILHSLIYGFVFYGYGLHMFGKLERYQLYFIVAGMWVVSLIISPIWLANYRFGPLEWCWRSLTYWRRQPMRQTVSETGPVPEVA